MYSKVSLSDLIHSGLLKPNTQIVWRRKRQHRGEIYQARLTAAGRIQTGNGRSYPTPSAAARDLNGGRPVNGWLVWKVGDDRGPTLAEVRQQLVEAQGG